MEMIPLFEPFLTRDMVKQMEHELVRDEERSDLGIESLGIVPEALEKHAVALLRRFRPPKATIGFELTKEVQEAPTWPDGTRAPLVCLSPVLVH